MATSLQSLPCWSHCLLFFHRWSNLSLLISYKGRHDCILCLPGWSRIISTQDPKFNHTCKDRLCVCLYVCVQVHQSRQHSQIPEIRTWVFWGDYYLSSHSHINGIKQYAVSHVWLLALSIMPLGIIQVVAYVNATLSGIPLYGWTTVC